ncbi:hypothetical protein [Aeromonas salmonicida]|uniref:hypothetical protein n=1 Tax=Aeromonas salmonicida TaxID=645 RepID=UPI00240E4304|nr:hypothetical protein [Aeromonas salmonicida]WFC15294.1 hypothetical protein L3V47_05975 [Aeromonas salmonicida]
MDFGFILYMMMCSLLIGGCLGGALIPWISKNKHHMEINSTTNGSDETISSTYRNKKRMLYSIIMIVFSIFIVVHLSTKAYQLSLIGSFKQHMRILAPFITSEQEKIIISKWSLMNGSNDYDEIYAELNSIAKNNNIILPSNKIYTLYSI